MDTGVGVEVEEIDVVIVGAGICGLATALALHRFLLLSVYEFGLNFIYIEIFLLCLLVEDVLERVYQVLYWRDQRLSVPQDLPLEFWLMDGGLLINSASALSSDKLLSLFKGTI